MLRGERKSSGEISAESPLRQDLGVKFRGPLILQILGKGLSVGTATAWYLVKTLITPRSRSLGGR